MFREMKEWRHSLGTKPFGQPLVVMESQFWARRMIDLRLEALCFRPEDLECPTFALAKEVLRTGIVV